MKGKKIDLYLFNVLTTMLILPILSISVEAAVDRGAAPALCTHFEKLPDETN